MTLIPTDAGQPYHRFRPAKLIAAAELIVDGTITIDEGRISVITANGGPMWRHEIIERLVRKPGVGMQR